MTTFAERLSQAEKINIHIAELLAGSYADERRLTLSLAYLNLSLDHHGAIICLMACGRNSSALALVRLVFEAMIRAHWVARCASDVQVDSVAEDDAFRFPGMAEMAKSVDETYSEPGADPLTFFQQAKNDAWKATNSYTHSGLLQLARQFSGGRIESKYSEEDLISGLNASTASVLLLGYLVARITGQQERADELERLFGFR